MVSANEIRSVLEQLTTPDVERPYPRTTQPTISGLGATFSSFNSLNSMTMEEHVQTMLDTVGGIGGAA